MWRCRVTTGEYAKYLSWFTDRSSDRLTKHKKCSIMTVTIQSTLMLQCAHIWPRVTVMTWIIICCKGAGSQHIGHGTASTNKIKSTSCRSTSVMLLALLRCFYVDETCVSLRRYQATQVSIRFLKPRLHLWARGLIDRRRIKDKADTLGNGSYVGGMTSSTIWW